MKIPKITFLLLGLLETICSAAPLPAPAVITSKVPEAAGYNLVYELDIAVRNDFTAVVPYTIDNTAAHATGSFWRVAYFLELDGEWVWVSMDAFTENPALLGAPATLEHFQQRSVSDLNVAASPGAGVAARTGSSGGNIEFWNRNYSRTASGSLTGGSSSLFDSNDTVSASGNYGSMQVHDGGAGETIFAFNKWNSTSGDSDLGIANQPTAEPDWTFASNAGAYVSRKLYVLVEPAPFALELDAFPKSLHFCPRDLVTNLGEFEVAGREASGGFADAILRLRRDGVPFGTEQVVTLDYTGGPADFEFTVQIPGGLTQFDAELVLRKAGGEEIVARQAEEIVSGDVFVVQGQSNADAQMYNGSANSYMSSFVRTFGFNTDASAATVAAEDWLVAQGDGSRNRVAGVGQWALVMGNQLSAESGVAIAILNGAHGGRPVSFFQRNDGDPEDLATNYGRLLYRARKAGLTEAVRGFFYYQGEAEGGNFTVWEPGFLALYNDWKEDYPNAARFYVFQLREGCGVARFNVGLRDVQRRLQDQYADMTAFSVNGLDGHEGCHYAFAGGYEEMGLRIADLVGQDYYGAPDDPNIEPPNPAYAELTGTNVNRIRIPLRRPDANLVFEDGAEADFALVGSSATVLSGEIVDGAIELELSGNASDAVSVVYGGHTRAGPWVKTSVGATLLTFSESLIATGPVPRFVSPARSGAVMIGVELTIEIAADSGNSAVTSLELSIGPNQVAAANDGGPLTFSWTPPAQGVYRLTARATDAVGRVREVELFALAGRPDSPGGVTGASVWLRPDTGIEVDSQGKVMRWLDQSGNGNHAEQLNPALQPAFAEKTFGCLPGVRLLPGEFLTGIAGMPTGSYTKVVRYQLQSLAQTNNILSSATGGTGTHALYHGNGASPRLFHGGIFLTSTRPINAGEEVIVIATYDTNTNLGAFYVNGVAAGTGTAAADNPSSSYQVGAYNSGNTMDGAVGEVLIFPRVLDGTEQAAVMSYFDERCLTPYEIWKKVTPGGLDPTDREGDGLGGRFEHALGLDPLVADAPPFIFHDGATNPVFAFDRPLGYDHVIYDVLLSSNLLVWHSVPVLPLPVPTPGDPSRERIIVILGTAVAEGPATFAKLRVVVE